MVYFFFIVYFILFIFDYIYIYTYLDSKIFLKKSGSKLETIIKRKQNNLKEKKKLKLSLKEGIIFIMSLLILLFLNNILFYDILYSKIVVLNLGYKKIDLVSTFTSYWQIAKMLYQLIYFIFIIIMLYKIINYYIFLKEKKNKEHIRLEQLEDNDVYLGKDIDSNGIYIKEKGLFQNILITGSIGSGKTSGAINSICDQLIKRKISGVILDVKGNYINTVKMIAKKYNLEEHVIVISDKNEIIYNPLRDDLKAIELANRIKKVLTLISPSNTSDSYWLDKVENVLYNIIILIRYYNDNKVDFKEIHNVVTDDDYLNKKLEDVRNKVKKNIPDSKISYELSNIFNFFSKEYFSLDSRVISIIKSEITRITIPFITDYEVYNKFGKWSRDDFKINISDYIENKFKIIVLSINISENYILSKIIATFLKLDFQKQVMLNIDNPIETFCICDEYQEFCNLEDANFLALSREAKCINVFSMQSYTSLVNVLKSKEASSVIIQNLVNKIWFRNDDNYTVLEVIKQIGKENKILTTKSITEGATETKRSIIYGGFNNSKSNISKAISYVESKDNVYDVNTFTRDLKTFEAIAFISNGDEINYMGKIIFERWDLNENKRIME